MVQAMEKILLFAFASLCRSSCAQLLRQSMQTATASSVPSIAYLLIDWLELHFMNISFLNAKTLSLA